MTLKLDGLVYVTRMVMFGSVPNGGESSGLKSIRQTLNVGLKITAYRVI